jgi:hypothetical protein
VLSSRVHALYSTADDIHYMYGFCDGNNKVTVDEYHVRFCNRQIQNRKCLVITQTVGNSGIILCNQGYVAQHPVAVKGYVLDLAEQTNN